MDIFCPLHIISWQAGRISVGSAKFSTLGGRTHSIIQLPTPIFWFQRGWKNLRPFGRHSLMNSLGKPTWMKEEQNPKNIHGSNCHSTETEIDQKQIHSITQNNAFCIYVCHSFLLWKLSEGECPMCEIFLPSVLKYKLENRCHAERPHDAKF